MQYTLIIEKGPTSYSAYLPDLPGCVAVGAAREEVEELIKGAIEMHLEGMREDGDPIPDPTTQAALVDVATHGCAEFNLSHAR